MKITKLLTLLTFAFLSFTINAQDCSGPTAQSELNANNVNATILNSGDLWWNGADGRYIFPKVDPTSGLPEVAAIFAGGLWLGGIDAAGNLKVAAQTYGSSNGDHDYFAGPLDDNGTTTNDDCNNYDMVFTAYGSEITALIADYADNGTIDDGLSNDILGWPARHNPNFFDVHGFELIETTYPLAPFYDQNGDAVYDPYDGDYPDINGADLGKWVIFNDAGGIHTSSQGDQLHAEVHLLSYAYNSTDPSINNTTFYEYTFINKGVETVDSVFAAIWVDPDLGCYTDDYVGCFPEDDLAFVYNSDAIDGETGCSCPGGVNTYCEEIPVLGVKVLDGALAERIFLPNGDLGVPAPGQMGDTLISLGMTSFIYYNNGGANPAPPPGTTDPASPTEYYNLMNGVWRDGTPITVGGTGYNPGSTDFTTYAFPGNPADNTQWSMCSENLDVGDRRYVMGSGPFRMQPGSVNRLAFAVIAQEDVAHPCPDLSDFQVIGEEVQEFYDNNGPITSVQVPVFNGDQLSVNPNPFTNQTQLTLTAADETLQQVQVYSISGKLLKSYASLSAKSQMIEKGNMTQGLYIYKALTDSGKVYTGKLVVR